MNDYNNLYNANEIRCATEATSGSHAVLTTRNRPFVPADSEQGLYTLSHIKKWKAGIAVFGSSNKSPGEWTRLIASGRGSRLHVRHIEPLTLFDTLLGFHPYLYALPLIIRIGFLIKCSSIFNRFMLFNWLF